VNLYAEDTIQLTKDVEVVIKSIDCGVETVVPVRIEPITREPACTTNKVVSLRTKSDNLSPASGLILAESVDNPFYVISSDKVGEVQTARLVMLPPTKM
jgi:hypothetical protein